LAEPPLHAFTAGDSYIWRYRQFPPVGPARAAVVALHGIQSHGGWYEQTCSALADRGYAVSFLDRRGCGLNDRDRGDAPSFRRLLDDITEYLRTLAGPRFLLGISWGGKLAVALQRRHPGLTDGLILIAPGLCPRVRQPLPTRLRILAARLVTPRRRFLIPLNDPELFTADLERQRFIRDDLLALREASARLLVENVRLDVYVRFALRQIRVPVLVLLAERDRIIDNAATRRLVAHIPAADRTVIEYAGAHHTLEFEPGGPPFLADLQTWLDRHTK
jgi:alpha-beta hydrolase superfamily lysophospholipase